MMHWTRGTAHRSGPTVRCLLHRLSTVCNSSWVISEYKYVWDECYVLFFFIKGRGCRFQSALQYFIRMWNCKSDKHVSHIKREFLYMYLKLMSVQYRGIIMPAQIFRYIKYWTQNWWFVCWFVGVFNGSKQSRLQQLVNWCGGEEFDGCLVFDECHKAKNFVPVCTKYTINSVTCHFTCWKRI